MKRSFKDRITALGLSYQKEMLVIVVISLIYIVGVVIHFIFIRNAVYLIMEILGLLAFIYLYFSRYSAMEINRKKEHIDELISLLGFFEQFISNGSNVYVAFRELIPYSSTFMEEAITSLLNQIDIDKTVGPFINFAAKFDNNIIESLMLSIYQLVDNGESSEQFKEFSILFNGIEKEHQIKMIEEKKGKLDTMDSWPLFGAGGITVMLAVAILNVMGELVDVL